MITSSPKPETKDTTKKFQARLLAVQSVYEMQISGRKAAEVIRDVLDADPCSPHATPRDDYERPLFSSIVQGTEKQAEDLFEVLKNHLNNQNKAPESLLSSILLCGLYEILAHTDVDTPIIINDYLDIAHGFYDGGEIKLINGILDNAAKVLRDS